MIDRDQHVGLGKVGRAHARRNVVGHRDPARGVPLLASEAAGQIDHDGLHVSNMRALGRALEAVAVDGSANLVDGSADLVDGFELKGVGVSPRPMVRGDQTSAAIAAASIVAKETRDRLMRRLDVDYPGYGFAVHKGYITRRHEEAVIDLGVSPAHRRNVRCKAYAALGLSPAA